MKSKKVKKENFKINIIYYLAFLILFLEVLFRVVVYKKIFSMELLYLILFTIPTILALNVIVSLFKEKISKIITFVISLILIIYFLVQIFFYIFFSVPFSFSTLGLAGKALGFTEVIVTSIINNLVYIIIFIIPIILLIIFRKNIKYQKMDLKEVGLNLLLIILLIGTCIISIYIDKKNIYSAYNLYYKIDAQEENIKKFGLLTATRLDLQRTILGFNESLVQEVSTNITDKEEKETIEYNKLDIDFEALKSQTTDESLLNIYNYIENAEPSKKNEYTGYFKGKNLIFILAEGFNSIAVNEELTPTLYKLCNSGFVFNNFYSPVFLSTTGGEFQATTGLIPSQSILSLWKTTTPTISYALGNSFTKTGYTANAYHNWTYDYYERNKTMKTLGFDSYLAKGSGLEKLMDCDWLPSDIDLINVTTDFYVETQPFVTFYITVSGHAPYNFGGGNSTAIKNKQAVENLSCGTSAKAYLAAQIELDKALEQLIARLEANGTLDNTVIALVGDHYPYTLSMEEINSISSYERDSIIEVNRSNFIVWNNAMKEVVNVDNVGSQIDVLPTLLNLFNIEYDSRLLIGQDILSDTPGIAIFSNRSWVSDKGKYFDASDEFILKDGAVIEEDYVDSINSEVANKFTMSNLFIKHKIYDKLFENN